MKNLLLVALALLVSGCVAGQSIQIGGMPESPSKERTGVVVELTVDEVRPYVISGRKGPAYIGHYRAGFGNTWDVTTQGKQALAEIIRTDLIAELNSLGFMIADNGFDRTLIVKVNDWNFDAYLNGRFWWDIDVIVSNQAGDIVAQDKLKDAINIDGSFWVGAKYAFEKQLPIQYVEIIRRIVRENPAILAALNG